MFLGIEIGGTKLQFGIGDGRAPSFAAFERRDVDAAQGATRIRTQISETVRALAVAHPIERIGIGFGGPLADDRRHTVCSHQVEGWENFPLVDWCLREFGIPTVLGNDADLAGLAEARFGAGRGCNPLFYITVGTGLGGGLIVDGRVYRGRGQGAAEIGHLRPGIDATSPEQTVEAAAAGPGIVAYVRREIGAAHHDADHHDSAGDLLARCGGDLDRLTARIVAEAAAAGNDLARAALDRAVRVLGWGVAQMITLLAPAAVVVGGGVSLIGEELFLLPLRRYVDVYLFPPFLGSCPILPAALGEEMVVHGALLLAADSSASDEQATAD